MAHARPVVVTPVGGIPDLVDDGVNGLLMPYGDPSALASALARLAEDPDSARRMGVAARQTVEQFTWERMISKLELTLERWR
jgi:glycosyltransferase involved in cell wall biosynthesis